MVLDKYQIRLEELALKKISDTKWTMNAIINVTVMKPKEKIERNYPSEEVVRQTLEKNNWHVTNTAIELGIHRAKLNRLMIKYKLEGVRDHKNLKGRSK